MATIKKQIIKKDSDTLVLRFWRYQGGYDWKGKTMSYIANSGKWGIPSLCADSFMWCLGPFASNHIKITLSTKPIPGKDWEPITLKKAYWSTKLSNGLICSGVTVTWGKDHCNNPKGAFYWETEKLLDQWLPDVSELFHLAIAVEEETE